MNTSAILLTLVLGAVGLLGILLWRLGRRTKEGGLWDLSSSSLFDRASVSERYQPMSRLFAPEDVSWLLVQYGGGPALEKRLHLGRKRVMRLYLQQMRNDFQQFWKLARTLARMSRDPNFAHLLTQQFLKFHLLMILLNVCCCLPGAWRMATGVRVQRLLAALNHLEVTTRRAADALKREVPPRILPSV